MEVIKRIFFLLLNSKGLTIKDIAKELDLDKYYVADVMFSSDNNKYWYHDGFSLWFAKEGAIHIEESSKKDELTAPLSKHTVFNIDHYLQDNTSHSLHIYLKQLSNYRIYSEEETLELFRRYRNGDKKAHELIVNGHQKLVIGLAKLYRKYNTPMEDIIQEGNIGLLRAIDSFDNINYRNFTKYAKGWILQSISLAMSKIPYTVRLPLNQLFLYRKILIFKEKYEQLYEREPNADEIILDESIDLKKIALLNQLPYKLDELVCIYDDLDCFASSTQDYEKFETNEENINRVNILLNGLKVRDRYILKSAFGIGPKQESLLFLREQFNLSRERIRQIVEKSLSRIRTSLSIGPKEGIKEDYPSPTKFNSVEGKRIKKISSFRKKGFLLKTATTTGKLVHEDVPYVENKKLLIQPPPLDNNNWLSSTQKKADEKQLEVKTIEDLKVGDRICYKKKNCIVKKIIENGRSSKLIVEYSYGVRDVVSYNKSKFVKLSQSQKSNNLNDINENRVEKNSIFVDVEEGDTIIYDSRYCIVIERKIMNGVPRLIVQYDDGTVDNVQNDKNKYIVLLRKKQIANSFNFEQSFTHYIKKIMNIRQAKIYGKRIVAKPVLLVAIIDAIESNVFPTNHFVINDWLEKRYIQLMRKYTIGSQFDVLTGIEKPFWHLESDGFWHLQYPGETLTKSKTPSKQWLKDNVRYAMFDDDLWFLLQNKEWRIRLRDYIIEHKLTDDR